MTEYLAENSRLRQLSRRYTEDQISFGEYRAGRRAIIEALEAGRIEAGAAPWRDEPPSAAAAPRTPPGADDDAVFLKTMPPRVTAVEPAADTALATPAAGWDNHTRILAAVLGLLALLAAAGLIYVMVL